MNAQAACRSLGVRGPESRGPPPITDRQPCRAVPTRTAGLFLTSRGRRRRGGVDRREVLHRGHDRDGSSHEKLTQHRSDRADRNNPADATLGPKHAQKFCRAYLPMPTKLSRSPPRTYGGPMQIVVLVKRAPKRHNASNAPSISALHACRGIAGRLTAVRCQQTRTPLAVDRGLELGSGEDAVGHHAPPITDYRGSTSAVFGASNAQLINSCAVCAM